MPVLLNDKRKHPRADVSLLVWWGEAPICTNKGRIVNIGAGGCFVQTMHSIGEGKTVFLRFAEATIVGLPAGALKCRMVYRLEGFGFGVEFVQMSADDERLINALVTSRLSSKSVQEGDQGQAS